MEDLDYKNVWDETLSLLKKELGEEEFSLWFSKVEYIRAEDSVIYVSTHSNFFFEMFKPKYLPLINKTIGKVSGKNLTVTLEVPKKGSKPRETSHFSPTEGGKSTQNDKTTEPAPAKAPATTTEKKKNAQLQEEYTFDTYVVGEDNRYAFNAAKTVALNPGMKIYNPLLIYGGTGLGKTHLMQAIGHYIHQNSDIKILYITGEGFMREFVEVVGMGQKNRDSFAKKYRNVDALLIDDIHTIEKGAGTQEELFYTFEALINKKKQMVFTCDRPISELKNMIPRLQSRFLSGVNVEIHMPKYEELIAILRKKMLYKRTELKNKEITLLDEVIELIIKNISTNIRDMEGALNKLLLYADLVNKPVTIEIAQKLLKDTFADPKQGNISMDIIQRVVAKEYDLTPNDLKGKKRTSRIVKPRQIAMFLCRDLTEFSSTEIGEAFGNRDHTTVLHSCKLIEEVSRSDTNLYSSLERLKRMIKEHNVK